MIGRRSFLAGSSAATLSYLLEGCGKGEDIVEASFSDPSKRDAAVKKLAAELGGDKLATWDYVKDRAEMAEKSIAYGVRLYRMAFQGSPGKLTVTPAEIAKTKDERIKHYEERYSKAGAVTHPQDFMRIGKSQKAHVYVLPNPFERSAEDKDNADKKGRRDWLRSTVKHEEFHARDFYHGFDLGGGLAYNANTSLAFAAVGIEDQLLELRAYGDQIVYDFHARDGQMFLKAIDEYCRRVAQCEAFLASKHFKFAEVRVDETVARQLEVHRQDPVLGAVLAKYGKK